MPNGDAIVIGAGNVGANVAYRLAARGARVTVLEAGAPGGGTSGVSFAWTNSFNKTPRDYHDLNTAGMAEHRALVEELGGGGWHPQEGAIAWEESPAARAAEGDGRAARELGLSRRAHLAAGRARPRARSLHRAARGRGGLHAERGLRGGRAAHRRAARPRPAPRRARPARPARDRRAPRGRPRARRDHGRRVPASRPTWWSTARGRRRTRWLGSPGIEIPFDRVPGRLIYTTAGGEHAAAPHPRAGRPLPPGRRRPHRPRRGRARSRVARGGRRPRAVAGGAVAARRGRALPALAGGARRGDPRRRAARCRRTSGPWSAAIPGLDGFYVVASHSAVTLGPLWGTIVAAELLDGVADPRLGPYRPARFLR